MCEQNNVREKILKTLDDFLLLDYFVNVNKDLPCFKETGSCKLHLLGMVY